MNLLSWDVGTVHLTYCILSMNASQEIKVLQANMIDLFDNQIIMCAGRLKNRDACTHKARHIMTLNDTIIGFCNTHLSQSQNYEFQNPFVPCKHTHTCHQSSCVSPAKWKYNALYWCTKHKSAKLQSMKRAMKCRAYNPDKRKKLSTHQLKCNLIDTLDRLREVWSMYHIQAVAIENQPVYKNPTMKAISDMIYDYFLIRALKDKTPGWHEIKTVQFVSACSKLAKYYGFHDHMNLENMNEAQIYKLTKRKSIEVSKQLIDADAWMIYYAPHKKQDDLCDAYLQGRYILEKRLNSTIS